VELRAYDWPNEWVAALSAPACSLVSLTLHSEAEYDATLYHAIASNKSLRQLLAPIYDTVRATARLPSLR
jgi:hypothetical protein